MTEKNYNPNQKENKSIKKQEEVKQEPVDAIKKIKDAQK